MLHASPRSSYTQSIYPAPKMAGKSPPDLCIRAYGEFRSHGEFRNEIHGDMHNVHVIRAGRGHVEMAGRTYELGVGDVLVFWPGGRVRYYDDPSAPWRYDWFLLAGVKVDWALAQCGLSSETPHLHCPAILPQIERMAATFRPRPTTLLPFVAEAWAFIQHLCEARRSAPPEKTSDVADICRRIIDSRYMNPLTIDDLARQFGLSRATLFRRFVAAFGVAPKQYLSELRLQKACELLASTDWSVKQVAYGCGFTKPCHFTRSFAKRFSVSPSTWRQTHRHGESG